jgi:hypothetical protein
VLRWLQGAAALERLAQAGFRRCVLATLLKRDALFQQLAYGAELLLARRARG